MKREKTRERKRKDQKKKKEKDKNDDKDKNNKSWSQEDLQSLERIITTKMTKACMQHKIVVLTGFC